MQISKDHIIVGIISLTVFLLVVAGFLLLYVALYNSRKKRHLQEKEMMQQSFEKELLQTQMEVQENTLKTIASNIHDHTGQLLSLTRMTLSSIDPVNKPDLVSSKVELTMDLTDKAIKSLRQMAHMLHAENVLSGGLQQAVQAELDYLEKMDRYIVSFAVFGDTTKSLGPERELIAFRIFQEMLTNIMRHADATSINTTFEYLEASIRLTIQDNGKGFNVEDAVAARKGLGLANFDKRIDLLKGNFKLSSEIGKGTTGVLNIPYL